MSPSREPAKTSPPANRSPSQNLSQPKRLTAKTSPSQKLSRTKTLPDKTSPTHFSYKWTNKTRNFYKVDIAHLIRGFVA